MSAREDEIRRVVAELDVHVAEVEAGLAALKALLAEVDVPDSAYDLPDLASRRGHPGDEAGSAHVPAADPGRAIRVGPGVDQVAVRDELEEARLACQRMKASSACR